MEPDCDVTVHEILQNLLTGFHQQPQAKLQTEQQQFLNLNL